MSERRRRSPNGDGNQQPPGYGGGRPYAYGTPPEGAPSYGASGRAGARGPQNLRETAQQPRMTRAEMRKAAQKGGRNAAPAGGGGRGGRGGGAKPPGKKRFIDYPRWGKSGIRRWLPSWKLILSLFLIFFGGTTAAVGVAYAETTVPDLNSIVSDQNNIYYWADGSEMVRTGSTNRQIVPLSNISVNVQNAVIAAENETFRTDSGIDPQGMARAIVNMAEGQSTQGGSTITQQYVKNAYLNQDQTVSRKLKEIFITLKINQKMSKDDILDGYLNTSWFGRNANGIQAAARAYYGIDASNLSPCQSAMLAGLLKGAGLYDPSLSAGNHARMFGTPSDPASGRWEWILGKMVSTKAITQDQMNQCVSAGLPEPIKLQPQAGLTGEIGYLVDTANQYIESKDPTITDATLTRGGYRIYTTFQKDKVDELKQAVDDADAKLSPTKRPDTDTNVQVGAASVVPGDGALVAIYGGPGYDQKYFTNNANASGVPVGSTFKPFVLATAMQVGVQTPSGTKKINQDSRYLADDMSVIYKPDGTPVLDSNNQPFRQKNDEPGPQGYVTLAKAMAQSFNVPYVQLGENVGGTNVEALAQQMGLSKASFADPNTASFALGTSTPNAIQMASAYSVFAARGQQTDVYSVTKVEFSGQSRPGFGKPTPKPVLDQAVADNITQVLQGVVQNGTGTKAQAVGRPVAGKTGTTDDYKSAWFDGYTPQLATAVSIFREDPNKGVLMSLNGTGGSTDGFYGGDVPTEIWAQYMKAALGNSQVQDFPTPQPVNTEVDESGAPSTASPSPSASASVSASPTVSAPATTAAPSPSLTSVAPAPTTEEPTTGPTSTSTGPPNGGGCGFFGCPPTSTPTRGHGHSPSPTDTATAGPTDGGGGLVGG
ncbi:transglycosylase domain-containing protein [Kitasatospora sp. NPDC052896]|uniref:transglycosylase domain-containing protein n=1 Tax=Kitasatospora sp. NPDC052896 TaxID=3364061 RepID=UPI0037CA27A4